MCSSTADLVRAHARTRPDAPALTCGPTTRTFAELDARSSQVAQALAAEGVRHGDRVGVLDKSSIAFFEVLFACAKLGAVVVGLNWRLAPPELAGVISDAAPAFLLVSEELQSGVPACFEGRRVMLGEEYERWVASRESRDPQCPVAPDDPVLQLYSSGTTGLPKGAVITHAGLSWTFHMAETTWRMGPDSVNLVPSPLFHIGGAGYGLTTLSQGGHTVLVREPAPETLLAAIAEHRVTHAFLVPAVVQSLLKAPQVHETDLSSLRLIGYGAAPMTDALLLRAIDQLGCEFLGVYGMTETSGTVSVLEPGDHEPGGDRSHLLRSVGRALPWVDLSVRDPVTGTAVPVGQVGEIWVRCGQNMAGYWRQPDLTESTLVEGGWLRTGDGAHLDEEGYVFLHDRLKDMIISGGENVYPAEVENVLAGHPSIIDVAVIAVPHERWGETVKAVVVLEPGAELTLEELVAFARTRLAGYKCPTSLDVVRALPRNASGKVLKKDLRAPYWPPREMGVPT